MNDWIEDIRSRYDDQGLTQEQYSNMPTSDIARMRVDVKRLLREVERLQGNYDMLKLVVKDFASDHINLSLELDAAIRDLSLTAKGVYGCPLCKKMLESCADGCDFEWRGVQDEVAT